MCYKYIGGLENKTNLTNCHCTAHIDTIYLGITTSMWLVALQIVLANLTDTLAFYWSMVSLCWCLCLVYHKMTIFQWIGGAIMSVLTQKCGDAPDTQQAGTIWARSTRRSCLTSQQEQSILKIPKGVPVNLTGNWQGEVVLSVVLAETCWFCPNSSKCAVSRAAKQRNRLHSRYKEKSTVKDCDARGSWLIYDSNFGCVLCLIGIEIKQPI